jgi:hypothetical protein
MRFFQQPARALQWQVTRAEPGERCNKIVNEINRSEEVYRAKLQRRLLSHVDRRPFSESAARCTIPLGLGLDCADHRQRLRARSMHYVRDAASPSAAQPV